LVTNASYESCGSEAFEFDGVSVERFAVGKHEANAYLVYSSNDRRAVLIDPGADPERLVGRLSTLSLDLVAVLLTHGHWDHVGSADEIASHTSAPVYIHPHDRQLLRSAPMYALRIDNIRFKAPSSPVDLVDGQGIPLGDHGTVTVHHLPGHTPGGVGFRIGRAVFTGDTLLPEEAGRTDLPGGNHVHLRASLASLLQQLAPNDVVCPGHGSFWPSVDATAWLSQHLNQ
jgi:hydroxyacylglutathione hydrolase